MTAWEGFTPLAAVCPDCGAVLAQWQGPLGFSDSRDEREVLHAGNALSIQSHRHDAHRVEPSVGDLVTYAMPWRGHILSSEVYRVDAIHPRDDFHAFARKMRGDDLEPLIGTSYTLVNPRRSDDRCFPFVGDPDHPITFEVRTSAPLVEQDLLELLGWDAA